MVVCSDHTKACRLQRFLNLFHGMAFHSVNDLFKLKSCSIHPVGFIADQEISARFQHFCHLTEALFQPRPEVYRLKRSGKIIFPLRQVQIRSGHYPAFFTDYTDADGRAHSIEIHAAFSIRKWKAGDRIRLRVSGSDPEKVIVRSSDAAMAVIMCSIGAALEAVLLAVLIRTH